MRTPRGGCRLGTALLRAAGYTGPIGLEYFPTVESGESLKLIRSLAATV